MAEPTQGKQNAGNTQGPEYRSNVEKAKNPEPGPRRWSKGAKVWVKNPETKTFDWLYYVSAYEYNDERRGWDYKVKNADGILYERSVPEGDLKKG